MKFSKKKILIIIIGILLILSLNFFQKPVKNFFYLISSPAQKVFWEGGNNISRFFNGIFQAEELKKANESLELENQKLQTQNLFLQQLREENRVLREALGFNLKEEFKLALTEVRGKYLDRDVILIDKGLGDGFSKNLAVITSGKCLVGKISQVYQDFSEVELISSKNISLGAKILNSSSSLEVSVLVQGKGSLRLFLTSIPREQLLQKGDWVVTGASGETFPKGLLVGKVKEIRRSDIEPFQEADLEMGFKPSQSETLFVVLEY